MVDNVHARNAPKKHRSRQSCTWIRLRKYSQSLNAEKSGHVGKNIEPNISERRNSSGCLTKNVNADTGASASAIMTHRTFPCRRIFSGTDNGTWHNFKKYFEKLAVLNNWSKEQSRRTLLCSLRDQAEAFAYGLPVAIQGDWDSLFS